MVSGLEQLGKPIGGQFLALARGGQVFNLSERGERGEGELVRLAEGIFERLGIGEVGEGLLISVATADNGELTARSANLFARRQNSLAGRVRILPQREQGVARREAGGVVVMLPLVQIGHARQKAGGDCELFESGEGGLAWDVVMHCISLSAEGLRDVKHQSHFSLELIHSPRGELHPCVYGTYAPDGNGHKKDPPRGVSP